MTVLLADFEKRYPGGTVIRAALERPADRFSVTVLFGPSGCGKTTILRCLAGLERPEHGRIRFADETWLDTAAGVFRPPQRRGIGFLFQDYALFPHMNVASNIAYGLSGVPRAERRRCVGEMLDMLGLTGMERRVPGGLSGGEQQRVALARALVMEPRLLLADEPTGNLDTRTGNAIHELVVELNRERGMTMLVVTHNEDLAARMPRRLHMVDGRIVEQCAARAHEEAKAIQASEAPA